ncbi:unnamed protein product [Aspergillus niger]|nr:unnamed protein product [Aspergillus niger]
MSTLQPSVNRALVLHPGGTFTHSERRIPTIESNRDVLVRVVATGLCGSDIHYWQHGKLGEYEVTQPLILAHESSGVIVATGGNFQGLKINDRVALEPRNPCNVCPYCRSGRYKLCTSNSLESHCIMESSFWSDTSVSQNNLLAPTFSRNISNSCLKITT